MELTITSPKYGRHIILYDDEDYELISSKSWYLGTHHTKKFYCKSVPVPRKAEKSILMHRFIMNAPPDKLIDHINGNTLDNRKVNLRLATASQNLFNSKIPKNNTTGFKGVVFNKRANKFMASARGEHLGYFKDKIDAAIAYNNYAEKNFGEFARLNKI